MDNGQNILERSILNGERSTDKTVNSQRHFLPYGRQWIDEEDIQAVVKVLRSDWLTQGPKIEEFEEAFASYVCSRYAVAANSGTAALHLTCLAAEMGPGDEVITSPITFVATTNCALYVGARPVFVDIDPTTFNIDPNKLEAYLEEKVLTTDSGQRTTSNRPRPRAVIPVHFAGLPCDMPEIYRIAKKFGLIIIEDACHALGAKYWGQGSGVRDQQAGDDGWIKVGSCAHSDMTVFSFHPVKNITTGEGGMVTTNNAELYEKLILLRNHGITRDSDKFTVNRSPLKNGQWPAASGQRITSKGQRTTPHWYYEMQTLGYNYRITDIQCALGLSQLKKVDRFVQLRHQIASRYREALSSYPEIQLPREDKRRRSAYHLLPIQIAFDEIGKERDEVMLSLRRRGIGTQVHYIPIPHHPYYRSLGFRAEDYPEAERFYHQCLSLPIFPALKPSEVERVIDTLMELLGTTLNRISMEAQRR